MLRIILITLLLNGIAFYSNSQIETVLKVDIDQGINLIEKVLKNKISDSIRLAGLGEFQDELHEPLKLNTTIAAYLISKRNFNIFAISHPDWQLHDINIFLKDKNSSNKKEFDSLFIRSFKGSEYCTEEFKNFILWVKEHNTKEEGATVTIKGVGDIVNNPGKFPDMNNYFIGTYVRPYNNTIADSLTANFIRYGNSNTAESDSIVLKFWKAYINVVEKSDILPPLQLKQLKFDYSLRILAYKLLKEPIDHNQKVGKVIHQNAIVEAQIIDDILQQSRENKMILFGQNSNMVYSLVEAYSPHANRPYLIPRNGGWFRHKYDNKYFCTVTTFADSAKVVGVIGSQRFQPITIYGDKLVKDLYKKRDTYYLPNDTNYVANYLVPVINSGFLGGSEIEIKVKPPPNMKKDDIQYNILFIFRTLTKAKIL